jgi:hypothetical protein
MPDPTRPRFDPIEVLPMPVRPIPLPMLPPGVMRLMFDPIELLPVPVRPTELLTLPPGLKLRPRLDVFCPKLRDVAELRFDPPARLAES